MPLSPHHMIERTSGPSTARRRDPLDFSRPSPARVTDFLLGGKDNVEADRALGTAVHEADPAAGRIALENRRFAGRVVRHLAAEHGVTRFVDIGVGLPAAENAHTVAQAHHPSARVLYLDHDPIVIAHGQALLAPDPGVDVVKADLRHPDELVAHPRFAALMDGAEPVAILLTAVLHHLSDADEPPAILRRLRDALPPGGFLALSHACTEPRPIEAKLVSAVYRQAGVTLTPRSRTEITGLFGDFELLDPGLTRLPEWRPEWPADPEYAECVWHLGGLARKPSHRTSPSRRKGSQST